MIIMNGIYKRGGKKRYIAELYCEPVKWIKVNPMTLVPVKKKDRIRILGKEYANYKRGLYPKT